MWYAVMVDLRELAWRQLADYDRREPGTVFGVDECSVTLEEAYAIQLEVARLRQARGERLAGYKVGCVSETVQEQLGLDRPVFGHVFESELHRSGVVLDSTQYAGLAIEGELAVRLGEGQVIESAFAVIELHHYVVRSTTQRAQELIANNAMQAGVVVPFAEAAVPDPDALLDETISVYRNSKVLGASTGRALRDGPFGSVVWLATQLARFGLGLRRGQIILTGSPLPLYRVGGGDFVEVVSKGLGEVVAGVS